MGGEERPGCVPTVGSLPERSLCEVPIALNIPAYGGFPSNFKQASLLVILWNAKAGTNKESLTHVFSKNFPRPKTAFSSRVRQVSTEIVVRGRRDGR